MTIDPNSTDSDAAVQVDLSFLGGDTDSGRLADVLDAVRPNVSVWSAAAIAARRPDLLRFRGTKGLRAWEQDLDFVLRRLHATLANDGQDPDSDRRWLRAVLAERGVDRLAVQRAGGITQEALLRFAGAADGAHLARRLQSALECAPRPVVAVWVG